MPDISCAAAAAAARSSCSTTADTAPLLLLLPLLVVVVLLLPTRATHGAVSVAVIAPAAAGGSCNAAAFLPATLSPRLLRLLLVLLVHVHRAAWCIGSSHLMLLVMVLCMIMY
jgi:hypothetical protein